MAGPTHGTVAPRFRRVADAFSALHAAQWDVGSAVAVFEDGRLVLEQYGGVRSRAPGAGPYDRETLQLVASSTKVAEALCLALLVDRGELSYDDRLGRWWPEFAAGDERKAQITVRQLMMHRAGLPAPAAPLALADLADPDRLAELLAAQPLEDGAFQAEARAWQGAAAPQCYHAVTRGLIASELVRRVDGRTLGQFFRDELAEPLGLRFWIGLPQNEEGRVAPGIGDPAALPRALRDGGTVDDDPRFALHPYERAFLRQLFTPGTLIARTLHCLDFKGADPAAAATQRAIRACEMPSSNGVCDVVSLAALAALAANGGTLFGQRLFASAEALTLACAVGDRYAADQLLLTEVAFTQGGFARLAAHDAGRTAALGWGGAGGSMVRFVPELRLGFAYITNTLGVRMAMNDPRPNALLAAALDCARGAG